MKLIMYLTQFNSGSSTSFMRVDEDESWVRRLVLEFELLLSTQDFR